ncbi:BglG family transcription antiterminator [Virgibacillus salinus]|uniref:Lichenan operon transcriptional antiterminator n=1 Tax=Virgibacillus salinus TaxID=553311 RepID=A0A1H0YPM3_9BACI|nr:BglG family transcription antiterminator [Virgibacillus salinus]SDQ17115.1 lichenan operon transcriptional antiterminator [Virgibacillus salinus]
MLNARMKHILRELMAMDSPITGDYLATINQVTARTTRNDVKNLNEVISEHGAKIHTIMGKGYQLEMNDDHKFRHFLKSIFNEEVSNDSLVPSLPEERTAYLIKRFLLSDCYLKLDDLADEIYVSKSTIQNDLKNVKTVLSDYDIHLESRPNHGLMVVGDELKLRFCMAEYVFDRSEEISDKLPDELFSSFHKKDMDDVVKIIVDEIKANDITLSDIAINNLLIHIVIAYKRIKDGHHVSLYHTDFEEIIKQKEFKVAERIVKKVENKLGMTFPEEEVAYVAIHLLGTKMVSVSGTGEDDQVDHLIETDTHHLVNAILEKIEDKMNLKIYPDQELLIALGLHLKPAINRYKYGMNIRNPMLEDIKRNYPMAYEAGIIAGLAIEEQTGSEINENEIGYLALHIGAAMERRRMETKPKRCLIVCASGLGSARLLYYRIKSKFEGKLEVIGTTQYYKLNQYDLSAIDFIISSVPIPEDISLPVIEVNAVLGKQDIENIELFVVEDEQSIYDYFHPELMFLKRNFSSKDDVLRFMFEHLKHQSMVNEAFLDAIYEREKVASTAYGNLVAVPHPISPQSDETFLSVCTLEKPVIWGEKPVQFVCILSVRRNSMEDLQSMYELLGKIIDSPTTVQKLINTQTYDQFIKALLQ